MIYDPLPEYYDADDLPRLWLDLEFLQRNRAKWYEEIEYISVLIMQIHLVG